MEKKLKNGLLICGILVVVVLGAGCSGDSLAGTTTPVPTTALPATKYVAGDIIAKSAASTDQSLLLITKYDPKTDMYSRALIYKNADGTWGHFNGNWNDTAERTVVEKVYPVKISHVVVSSIPVVTYTVPVTTQTTVSGNSPTVLSVLPVSGARDATVIITITGTDFKSGATATLTRAGSPSITATAVSVSSSTKIDGTFNLFGGENGNYNVVVTNPDGQSDTKMGAFSVGDAPPMITSVSPSTAALNETPRLTINGQNFKEGVKVTLVQGTSEIVCVNPVSTFSTKISCDLDLGLSRGGKTGNWDVTVLNIDGQQKGTLAQKFQVTNSTGKIST